MLRKAAGRRTLALLGWLGVLLASGAHADIRVTDDAGRVRVLARPAQRVISLAPHTTELLFAAGAGDRVVAVSAYSDFPPRARTLPRVSGGGGIDVERILALQPDLVVAWQSGNSARQLEQLTRLGLSVFYSEPRSIDGIATNLERLGRLTGSEQTAGRAAAAFRRRVEQLRRRFHGRRPVSVFYQIWERPLMTVNGQHLISAWLRLCGGRNLFAGLHELAPTVSREAVIAADPDAIVAGSYSGKGDAWQAPWRQWPQMKAVRRHHLLTVPAAAMERPTPRAVRAAETLCVKLDQVRDGE